MIREFKEFGPPEMEGWPGVAWGHEDAKPLISYTAGYVPAGAPFEADPDFCDCFAVVVDAGSNAPDVGTLTASIHYVDAGLTSHHYEYEFAATRPDADGFKDAAALVTKMLADLPDHDALLALGWSYFVNSVKQEVN
jgi:hypothetical protein